MNANSSEEVEKEAMVTEAAFDSSVETSDAIEQAKAANERSDDPDPDVREALEDASLKADRTVGRVHWLLSRFHLRRAST